jgi:hypothetical protein
MLIRTSNIVGRISAKIMGHVFGIRVENDLKVESNGRTFIQVVYSSVCTKTDKEEVWHGRKWYLSEHMTDDEIVKTCYAAFEAAVKHEVMEGFKVDGKILFNPHINFEELLKISDREIERQKIK